VIEVRMVRRMALRALALSPVVIGGVALAGALAENAGAAVEWGLSAAIGLAMTIGNLWLAAAIIGGVAERDPRLLLPAALGAFALGLMLLTGIAFVLQKADLVYFPVTGFVLIGSHLGLVLWDAAGAYGPKSKVDQSSGANANVRS
jgi:ATP synthase protein I